MGLFPERTQKHKNYQMIHLIAVILLAFDYFMLMGSGDIDVNVLKMIILFFANLGGLFMIINLLVYNHFMGHLKPGDDDTLERAQLRTFWAIAFLTIAVFFASRGRRD